MPLTGWNYLLNAFRELPPGAIGEGLNAALEAELLHSARLGYGTKTPSPRFYSEVTSFVRSPSANK
jgi:hypothetical protein